MSTLINGRLVAIIGPWVDDATSFAGIDVVDSIIFFRLISACSKLFEVGVCMSVQFCGPITPMETRTAHANAFKPIVSHPVG